jgi:hypothetical protein
MNSKKKGNNFEREISKTLSLFLSEGKRDDLLYRTSNSGGRFTSRFNRGISTTNQNSDITSIDKEADSFSESLSIEVKHYKNIDIWSLITNTKDSNILSFWEQTKRDADRGSKLPLLIVKQNYKPILLITNKVMNEILNSHLSYPKLSCRISDSEDIFVYLFDDFLKINPEALLKDLVVWKTKP